jgi:hypothetical protein
MGGSTKEQSTGVEQKHRALKLIVARVITSIPSMPSLPGEFGGPMIHYCVYSRASFTD